MSDNDNDNGEYEVGRGRPPKHTQFKKGQSGNPKGRPPKPKPDAASVAAILDAPVDVRKGGKVKKMSSFEVIVRKLVSLAINEGDVRAAREFFKYCDQYGGLPPAPQPRINNGFTVPWDWDWDEWVAKLHRDGPPPWHGKRDGLPKGPPQ